MLTVQEIREIIKLIDQSSIDEFTYETNGTSVTMKKNQNNEIHPVQNKLSMPDQFVQTVGPQIENVPTEPIGEKAEKEETNQSEKTVNADYDYEIVSPMVGTLYSAPSPESGAYVNIGSKVETDTVVCIVEAMKLFNEIEAETTGEIVEILVEDGELVEYGQPLFRVKTK